MSRRWKRQASNSSKKLGVPGPCPGECGRQLHAGMTLVRVGKGPWTCEICDGVVKNDSQHEAGAEKFRSSNTGTLSHFETDSLDLAPMAISPSAAAKA